ncbi:MAG: 4,5-DOPA dioxygenase extradiol [Chitinophagales bacterium]|nr:4,5-DOPA dioxygenase extradiol [Chitinophagales bacterium]
MNRIDFIQNSIGGLLAMTSLKDLKNITDTFNEQDEKMPLFFIGHGSPMNGIHDNEFSQRWQQMGKEIPKPKAVLCVSAHWLTKGTFVTAMDKPKTIHDFGGFPDALFQVQYPAPGNPALAKETAALVKKTTVGLDHDWGLDHGTWMVVKHMYPNADIPVLQLSIDYHKPGEYHFELAKELSELRKKGVLIIGSGNMVHNLGMVTWSKPEDYAFDWAIEMNETFKKHISTDDFKPLLNYESLSNSAKLAIPTPDHYYPLLYVLGLKEENEKISFFNDKAMMGSITMTSVKVEGK